MLTYYLCPDHVPVQTIVHPPGRFRFTLTHPPANKQKLGFPEKFILAVQKNLSSFWCNKTQDNSLVLLASKLVPFTDSTISEFALSRPFQWGRDRDTLFRNIVQASLSTAFHRCSGRGQDLVLQLMQRDPAKLWQFWNTKNGQGNKFHISRKFSASWQIHYDFVVKILMSDFWNRFVYAGFPPCDHPFSKNHRMFQFLLKPFSQHFPPAFTQETFGETSDLRRTCHGRNLVRMILGDVILNVV